MIKKKWYLLFEIIKNKDEDTIIKEEEQHEDIQTIIEIKLKSCNVDNGSCYDKLENTVGP